MNFFEFASNSPILTFFLALFVTECIVRCVQCIANACVGETTSEDDDESSAKCDNTELHTCGRACSVSKSSSKETSNK